MHRLILCLILLIAVSTIPIAMADDDHHNQSFRVRTHLSGFNEVHFIAGNAAATPIVPPALRGAVSTAASGKFMAKIDEQDQKIHYTLSYKNLEGEVTQSHIHFGQRHTPGGIVVWLCQTPGTPAPAAVADVTLTPFCPPGHEGTVGGTITPAQVLTVTGQLGIRQGESNEEKFDELVRAIRAGVTYANVHSSVFGPGEIRGQIPGHDDD